jgi:hypothetical protein
MADSIKEISRQMAEDMLSFYQGDKPGFTPGLLPEPYYCRLTPDHPLAMAQSTKRIVAQGGKPAP